MRWLEILWYEFLSPHLNRQNLSARLMVAAKGKVLCDIDTYEAVKSVKSIDFKNLGKINVKGISNHVIFKTIQEKPNQFLSSLLIIPKQKIKPSLAP
jgi:hypothetical protein